MQKNSLASPLWLNFLYDSTRDGLVFISDDGVILRINPMGCYQLGKSSEDELLDKNLSQFFNPADKDLIDSLLERKVHQNSNDESVELRTLRLPQKILLTKFIRIEFVDDSIDDKAKYVVSLRDITDQKISDKMLNFFARATSSIGSSLDWGTTQTKMLKLAVPDLADWCSIQVLDDNKKVTDLVEYSSAGFKLENFPKKTSLIGPSQVIKSGVSVFKRELNDKDLKSLSVSSDHFNEIKENDLLSFMCVPIRLGHLALGTMSLLKKTAFDREDQIIAEELANRFAFAIENARMYENLSFAQVEIQKAKLVAEQANKAKSEFLANMSHEIRTPLGAMLGFTDLILSPDESPQNIIQWSRKIKSNGVHLLKLIDEILDLSKIESGKIDISIETFDLTKLLSEVSDAVTPQVSQKNLNFVFNFKTKVPQFISSDPVRLKQMLINIIGNATKFTAHGSITVDISYDVHLSTLQFMISDTGIGLTPDQAKNLFKPFSQGDASHTRKYGGTGLGLSLSRRLANCLNGDITLVSSKIEEGTTFKIVIPIKLKAKTPLIDQLPKAQIEEAIKPARNYELENLQDVKVLLVEDSKDNQILINHMLKKMGIKLDIASDGMQGLSMASSNVYDLILMDIQMPLLDGYEVCEQLRGKNYKKPIIALTAYALAEEKAKSLAAGFDSHLTKPVNENDLFNTVKTYGLSLVKADI